MLRVVLVVFAVLIFSSVMAAQPGGAGPGMGGNGGSAPPPGSQMGDGSRPMDMAMPMLSGTIVMEDGSAPPAPAAIERVCAGAGRAEAKTNEKGGFRLPFARMMPGQPPASNDGCSVRAALAGFRSDTVDLTGRKPGRSDLGKLALHPLEGVKGFTFSKTTKAAPKDARKQLEGARESLEKNKPEVADKQLHKAVEIYPAYAEAWEVLGSLQLEQKKADEAKGSFEQALKADPEYVPPYPQLARLAASQNDWKTVVDLADKCVALNPYYSPELLLSAALANRNLRKLDVAQTRAEQAVRADEQNVFPRARYILGLLQAERGSFKEAAESLRAYLRRFPNTNDAATVKQQLAQIEQRAAAAK